MTSLAWVGSGHIGSITGPAILAVSKGFQSEFRYGWRYRSSHVTDFDIGPCIMECSVQVLSSSMDAEFYPEVTNSPRKGTPMHPMALYPPKRPTILGYIGVSHIS